LSFLICSLLSALCSLLSVPIFAVCSLFSAPPRLKSFFSLPSTRYFRFRPF
jgi:hypothetical protein